VSDIVIKISAEHKDVADAITAFLDAMQRRAATARSSGRATDYAKAESELADKVMAIERAGHAIVLAAHDVDEPELMIDGSLHRRVLRSSGTFRTMAGAVSVERSLYRPVGVRNAPTVDPVAVRVGAVGDGWLPATAAAMAHAVQMTTSRDAEQQARAQSRLPYSRSSFEAVAHQVGGHYVGRRADVEDALIERFEVPEPACSVSVSLDRVSIPMAEPRPRPPGRPRNGAAKNPIDVVYRMGYCGTATLHDGRGEALHTIRYGRMSEGDVNAMVHGMAVDVMSMLEQRPDLKVVSLADGAPELWNRLDGEIAVEVLGVNKVYRFIDLWHVLEKLGAAARVTAGDDSDATVRRWKMLLLNRRDAAELILDELRASGCEDVCVGEQRPVHDAITYLTNNADRMRYTEARRNGLPIGSGHVEATCKSLVATRMKRPGARWKQETGEHIIGLRALALSDRWDDAMRETLKPLRRAVRSAA
jgi:hypothetical protein